MTPLEHRGFREGAAHFVRGLLMGGADIIPGVSGGTAALILGIYARLIAAVHSGSSAVIALVRINPGEAKRWLAQVEWKLIVPLCMGIAAALLLGSHTIPALTHAYPSQSLGLFMGLVGGSAVLPWRHVGRKGPLVVGLVILAALVAFVLTGLPPRAADATAPSSIRVFLSAAVAICAMILPGVSGAFLLKALGIYEVTLHALRDGDIGYVGVFIAGATVGLGVFSKLLHRLLERWASLTMATLVGLMIGALRALWPWQGVDGTLRMPVGSDPFSSVLAIAAAGFLLVTFMARRAHQIERQTKQAPGHSSGKRGAP